MVCYVSSEVMNNHETIENMEILDSEGEDPLSDGNENSDDYLKLKRIAGGNIVKYPPLYSPDGELLFVIDKKSVRVFSTKTGQCIRNLEGAKENIVALEYDIDNEKLLVGCSESGEVIKWKWETGTIQKKFNIKSENFKIRTFNLLHVLSNSSTALITYTQTGYGKICWSVVNFETGKQINCPFKIDLKSTKALVTVERRYYHYFVLIDTNKMYIVNYRKWQFVEWDNARKKHFTYVTHHPVEETIATGDTLGRIFLWREFWVKQEPKTVLYHWHHTEITSICFTNSGSGFYSCGKEAVLVKWNIHKSDLNFLPRMSAPICHIVASRENNIAVCTSDNGIHILNSQQECTCVIQNFTFTPEDKTELDKNPVGIKFNPRLNCLVLNGRWGHLQFYSTHTESLLYNMDIANQNRLSIETHKILYNIRVTKAAFNIDWMVTGEEWNDQEHSPELRIKFWEFKKENQSYFLNTNIELPHEGGFRALEFSDPHQSENLLCVSVGCDNVIKIWSLEDSDNIYKKGKVWYCTGRTSFKDFPIESVSFSSDGSLLAAGFGNNLCIYKSDNLKMKAVLTAPPGYDGSIGKIRIKIPEKDFGPNKTQKEKNVVKRKKHLELFKDFIDNGEQELIEQLKKSKKISHQNVPINDALKILDSKNFSDELFEKILSMSELNFFQKLIVYQKLNIFCKVPKQTQKKMLSYLACTILNARNEKRLKNAVYRLSTKEIFKAKYRLHKYYNRKKYLDEIVNKKLVPLTELLDLNDQKMLKKKKDSFSNLNGFCDFDKNNSMEVCVKTAAPVQYTSSIRKVVFGTGEHAHLVVVCTEYRVLIWNILTLKLQCILKLSVREITVDPITSLFAVFTAKYELYVFLPNAPMILYHRKNLPTLKGACWVPRRHPKPHSINLDWQSTSNLYLLSHKQELLSLVSDKDLDSSGIIFSEMSKVQKTPVYTTFGAYATKQIESTKSKSSSSGLAGVPGKAFIKSLIEMATHAMAPAYLLCENFTKSLLGIDEIQPRPKSRTQITESTSENNDKDSDDDDGDERIKNSQKKNLTQDVNSKPKENVTVKVVESRNLKKILNEKINIDF